jgi:hypothetical protein
MLGRTTLHTVEDKTQKRNKLGDTSKYQLYDKGQLAKLLSYHPMTDVRLSMEEEKAVYGFHHYIFHSIASDVMSWPFFFAFVPIDNDDE